jgi:hypothetical protein
VKSSCSSIEFIVMVVRWAAEAQCCHRSQRGANTDHLHLNFNIRPYRFQAKFLNPSLKLYSSEVDHLACKGDDWYALLMVLMTAYN